MKGMITMLVAEIETKLVNHEVLSEAMGKLTKKQRRIINLKYGAGLEDEQIAKEMDISVEEVNTIHNFSLAKMKVEMTAQ
jgi:RNA polymerase sigma factor (sigma-70 family)